MYVDTGATSVCMSAAQARNFGLNVPEDAVDTVINTTTGRMTGKKFSVRSLKLGPVEKRNVDVMVVDNYAIPLPLLGQSFLGDANYSVDDQAKVIRFNRR
jgi:aspartyl protease family protein